MIELNLWFQPVKEVIPDTDGYPVMTITRRALWDAINEAMDQLPSSKLSKKTVYRLCANAQNTEWFCVNNFEVCGVGCLVTQSSKNTFEDWPDWKIELAESLDKLINDSLGMEDSSNNSYLVQVEN